MTKKRAPQADKLPVDDVGGGTALVADEDVFDRRRLLWRLTSWGVAAIGAVSIAILANQSSVTLRRDQAATAELARQTQQIRALARQNHTEASRLASAIEALDGDRDRLDARVSILEQGLESVTGSIARQAKERKPTDTPLASPATAPSSLPAAASSLPHHEATASAAQPAQPAPVTATSATTAPRATAAAPSDSSPPTPISSADSKTSSNTPDATAPVARPETKVTASAQAAADQAAATDMASASSAAPSAPVQRTEFGVDLGSANSIDGLRALWRGVLRAHSKEVGSLEPIIVIRERTNGPGMRLHLVAGPLSDAAAAARICAALTERKRSCETSVYDGQRLTLRENKQSAGESAIAKPPPARRTVSRHKRSNRLTRLEQPVPLPAPPPPPEPAPSRTGSFFSR
jgi:hypothetical protein